ncbi:MAG: type III-B CRISPR module RAMP protein Cmr4 [Thermoguttaceae bacterium]
MNSTFFWIHALTPLHVGAGRGLGYIDLPIVREKVTNFPYIPGSAIKGVIADKYGASDKETREECKYKAAAFGTSNNDAANSGSLVFTDARLICLPVRSLYGTFAWCTSPTILRRLQRDSESMGTNKIDCGILPEMNSPVGVIPTSSALLNEGNIYLEDLDISVTKDETAKSWADYLAERIFQQKDRDDFVKRFVVLADDVFNFLCETGTEVAAHIKIYSEKKTVATGALWYEESLPAESILAGVLWCDKVYEKNDNENKITKEQLRERYAKNIDLLQFGGKATTGKGIVRCLFDTEGEKQS